MLECLPCPQHSIRRPGSAGVLVSECLCEPGYYRPDHSQEWCAPCPIGGVCLGFGAQPYPREGYWGDLSCTEFNRNGTKDCPRWDTFVACTGQNCEGGPDFRCGPGRRGRLCTETQDGWYTVGSLVWHQCGEYGQLTSAAGILAVCTVWTVLELYATGHVLAFNTALIFLQMVSMIGGFKLRWHAYLVPFNVAIAIANFDVDFFSPHCLASWSAISAFYLQLALPLLIVVLYLIVYIPKHLLRAIRGKESWGRYRWRRLWQTAQKHLVGAVILVYHTLCIRCTQVFQCDTFPDGAQYMKFYPEVPCWASDHWFMVLVAAAYIVGVLLLLPLLAVVVVERARRAGRLHEEGHRLVWGWYHDAYEQPYKWWEVVLLARRTVVAVVSVALDSPMIQGALTICALTSLLAGHVYCAPYISAVVDVLDFCSLCGCIFYVLAGLLMFSPLTEDSEACVLKGDAEHCANESKMKEVLAIVALGGITSAVLVCMLLAWRYTSDQTKAKIAYKLIKIDNQPEHTIIPPEDTANKVELKSMLHGRFLLPWIRSVKKKEEERERGELPAASASAASEFNQAYLQSQQSYLVVDNAVRSIGEDVSHYSGTDLADSLRLLCEIQGLIDFLSQYQTDSRTASLGAGKTTWGCVRLWLFQNTEYEKGPPADNLLGPFLVEFAKWRSKAKERKVALPIESLILHHYKPLVIFFLLFCTAAQKTHWNLLVSSILKANNIPLGELATQLSSRNGAHSQSQQHPPPDHPQHPPPSSPPLLSPITPPGLSPRLLNQRRRSGPRLLAAPPHPLPSPHPTNSLPVAPDPSPAHPPSSVASSPFAAAVHRALLTQGQGGEGGKKREEEEEGEETGRREREEAREREQAEVLRAALLKHKGSTHTTPAKEAGGKEGKVGEERAGLLFGNGSNGQHVTAPPPAHAYGGQPNGNVQHHTGPAGVAWSAEEEEEEWGVAELDAQHRERRAHAHLLPRQLHQPQHQHQHQQHQQEEVKEEEEEEEEEEQEQERGGAGTGVEELLLGIERSLFALPEFSSEHSSHSALPQCASPPQSPRATPGPPPHLGESGGGGEGRGGARGRERGRESRARERARQKVREKAKGERVLEVLLLPEEPVTPLALRRRAASRSRSRSASRNPTPRPESRYGTRTSPAPYGGKPLDLGETVDQREIAEEAWRQRAWSEGPEDTPLPPPRASQLHATPGAHVTPSALRLQAQLETDKSLAGSQGLSRSFGWSSPTDL